MLLTFDTGTYIQDYKIFRLNKCMYVCMYVCVSHSSCVGDSVPELQSFAMRGLPAEEMIQLIKEEITAWSLSIHTYIHTYIHTFKYSCMHTYTKTNYEYTHIHSTCVRTYVHTYIYTYIVYTVRTHTYIPIP